MPHSTTPGRALAIAAGAIFTAGTCAILFEDVLLKGAAFQLKHGLASAVLAGTILAGHLANDASRARHWLASAGFALVFVVGTALVVYSSVGRQAADTMQTTAQIEADAGRRVEISRARTRSADMLEAAQRELAAECKSGQGKRCGGIRATIEVYTAAIAGHDAALGRLGPVRVASPDAEQFAEIVNVVLGADKAKVKAAAVLIAPFLVALFLEFGVIVSLGFAFSHTPRKASGGHAAPAAADTAQTSFPAPGGYPDRPGGPGRRMPAPVNENTQAAKGEVIAWCRDFEARTGRAPSWSELRAAFTLPKSTASVWRRQARDVFGNDPLSALVFPHQRSASSLTAAPKALHDPRS